MMRVGKVLNLIILVSVALLFNACTKETNVKTQESKTVINISNQYGNVQTISFEIYLVKDLTTSDAKKKELNELPLEEKPILVNAEIAEYDWTNHEIKLINNSLEKELNGKVPVSGKPFVVVANGERIYLGAFWTPISSLYEPDIPIITSTWMPQDNNKVYKITLHDKSKEVRNDKRIYEALKRRGILKEPELNVELHIFKLFKGLNTSKQSRQEIFKVLPDIDWYKYEKVSSGKSVELLSWIDSLNITNEKEITTVFKATKNLDGAHAEQYSTVVGKMYLRDKVKFIKYLNGMQYGNSKTEEIAKYVVYYIGYFPNEYKKAQADTEKMLNNNTLSEGEKMLAEQFVKAFKKNLNK